ncbi:c-type cytochrome [Pedobacter metabolipauper]|uniref:Quinol:cytochrome c oxidoreductase pentaheme cytochrome subunit n=1 Tax=Pedobacter metabolipauper TaxID=425513 RepID=A0A4R6SS20_9SPHI|nr:c-type cytochrome [Pedobacter metabolipauper]TDQ06571.1 quinol:cytochrome c oxidoreductase pentaheme cytochrome subunit [Pedobacter metabolipauper]
MRDISLIVKRVWKSAFMFTALSVLIVSSTQAQDVVEGRKLFKDNCSSCHQLDRNSTGPALTPKLTELDEAWAVKWIKNWKALVDAGDKQAIEASKFSPAEMTAFPRLKDEQIKNIIAYAKAGEPKKAGEDPKTEAASEGVSDFSIAGIIAIILISIAVLVVLGRAIKMLERLILQKQGVVIVEEENVSFATGIKGLFKNKKFVFFFILCLVISLGSFGWMGMWNTGVHTGYQPVQPIKFSHELHAGTNQIDCQYCHAGAFKSKNSTIPSLNVCMNCHKSVQATEKYDGEISPEIQKIYSALGYDPGTMSYDKTKQKPIEWVRVHNLPDFAYFNHSQHVVVGEQAIRKEKGLKPNEPVCFACHGPVDTMEEIYQYSPLTMKWCINCHKDTKLDVKGNAFYDKIIEAHEKIKKGEKITPAALGGLECGKCHY